MAEHTAMTKYWLGIVIDTLPDSFEDGVALNEGFSDEVPEDTSEFQYAILARTVASSKGEAEQLVRDASRQYAPSHLRVIADQPQHVIRDERRVVATLSPGDVSLKNSFIGFKKDCSEAGESAFGIISLAIRKSWWQFWR